MVKQASKKNSKVNRSKGSGEEDSESLEVRIIIIVIIIIIIDVIIIIVVVFIVIIVLSSLSLSSLRMSADQFQYHRPSSEESSHLIIPYRKQLPQQAVSLMGSPRLALM